MLSNNHLPFFLRNFVILRNLFRYAPYYRGTVCLLIFLITSSRCFRILDIPSHLPLGICHKSAGVAINQPHGIRRITSVILTFRLLSLFHLWFSYRLPGPATSPRCSPVKRTFGSPSHLPLGICHQSSGVSIYPPDFRPFRNFRCPGL